MNSSYLIGYIVRGDRPHKKGVAVNSRFGVFKTIEEAITQADIAEAAGWTNVIWQSYYSWSAY